MSKFFGLFKFMFFRKRAQVVEATYEGIVSAARACADKTQRESDAVTAGLVALSEEKRRLESVAGKLRGLGL